MILRRVIEHFRKINLAPLIPAKAGIHFGGASQEDSFWRARRRALDPGFRRDERVERGREQ